VSTPRILFDVDGPETGLAFLTVNRPEARNAMTSDMYQALVDACDRVDQDPAIRVFVIRGAGGQAFMSGTDIAQFTRFRTREDALAYEGELDAVVDRLERVAKPTIAQVQGVATGGGCLIALACDLRVCSPDARFGVPVARTLGNCLSAANCARLLDLLGPARTRELMFTGRLIEAAEAHTLGLTNRVVDAAAIDAAVRELAATVASNAPLTLRATKEMVRRLQAARRIPQVDANDLITMCYLSDDFREGVAAFLAKRSPSFKGR
jgi:enoyl-CoA hydratase/carnithine racemase